MPVEVFGSELRTVPGTVVMWSGNISDIPPGWTFCDGTDGTPDLRDRFARGSSSAGSTGGNKTRSLSSSHLPEHNHTGGTDSQGNHTHKFGVSGFDDEPASESGDNDNIDDWSGFSDFPAESSSEGSHNHTVDSSTDTAGSGSSFTNEPQHYEIAFVMKT